MATHRPSLSTSHGTKKRKIDNSSFLEEEERKIITSSSSYSLTPRRKYDVFLTFYGDDTRTSFTDHLFVELKRKGIIVFWDKETAEQGKCISQELLQAIQESQYAIVILSANYAYSKWCLMELAKIVEWEEKKKITIIPIFYHVDPSDVRNQIGSFAEAFATHEKDPKVDTKEIDMWRNAFRKVGNIVGHHIKYGRYESEIIQKISEKIFYNYTVPNILIHDFKKLVGINSCLEQMMNLLAIESNDVRFVGIHGMGGVGKTTLAEVIYARVSCRFEGSCFISCIREKSSTARDLAYLQKQLLSMIMREKILVWDPYQGISMLRSMLQNKKVFIILDDVDSEKQLMALAGNQDWFGAGSRVIITCRDIHLLITHKVNDIYKVELLQTTDALQLFSLSAFGKIHPPKSYMDLCKDFVRYAQGLPLALKTLGSFLFGRTIDAWKSARDQLEVIPNKAVMNILQISFEGLQDSQKKLFLDMAACCFQGPWLDENLKEIYPNIDIEVLIDKSLVRKSKYGYLVMHDLLQKMGQEIVRRECPEEPGRRSRLFRQEDVFHVLKNDTGTDAIEGIVLDFCHGTKESLNAESLSKMKNLRVVKFRHSQNIEWHGNPLKYMPTSQLQILDWFGCHLKSWPTSFQPKNLTILSMHGNRFKRLWKGLMVFDNLKYLSLSSSKNLIETPDLTGAQNLEKIYISNCRNLSEVHSSIGVLKRLKILRISGSRIKKVWKGLVVLDNLKYLSLSSSKNLIETPDLTGAPNLEKIYISNCRNLCEVHPSIEVLKRLQVLSISNSRIKQVWKGLVVFDNLKILDLSYSENLIETPDLTGAPNLEQIYFSICRGLCEVHPSIRVLKRLQVLRITSSRIKQVWKGLVVFDNLKELDLSDSENLIETPDLTGIPNIEKIYFPDCKTLCEVHPSIGVLKRRQELRMSGSRIKQVWKGFVVFDNLKYLSLSYSKNMIETLDLTRVPNLKKIDFSGCKSSCEIHPSIGVFK